MKKKLLYISVNSKPENLSSSKMVARKFINKFLERNGNFKVEEVDLYKEHIPRLEYQYFKDRNCVITEEDAKKLPEKDQKEIRKIRNLCDQFISAQMYVIAAPMWSLSFPAPLKEYIDCIVQEEKTISFELLYPVDETSDTYFIISLLSLSMVIQWLQPQVDSILNTAPMIGGKEEKKLLDNHKYSIQRLQSMKEEQKKMIRDYGYMYNSYLNKE